MCEFFKEKDDVSKKYRLLRTKSLLSSDPPPSCLGRGWGTFIVMKQIIKRLFINNFYMIVYHSTYAQLLLQYKIWLSYLLLQGHCVYL